jgi:hypothetical protein
MLKEATARAEEAECIKNTNTQIKAAVNEAIDHVL